MSAIRGYHRIWIDHTLDVDAPVETVMKLLSDVDQWASWTPGLSQVERKPGEPLRVGSRFTMHVAFAPFRRPLRVPCKLYRLERDLIEWGGDTLGSVVRHRFELTPLGPTRTRVRQLEYATHALALLGRLAERGIYKHDLRWQEALRERFATA